MRSIFSAVIWSFISSVLSIILLFSVVGLGHTIGWSLLYALGSWILIFTGGRWLSLQLFLKKQGLSRSDYSYIKQHLKEARHKMLRLKKALFAVKNVQTIKHNFEILRLARRIYTITVKEPKRFYDAQRFYFESLDTVVQLTEKYALLFNQPNRSHELDMTLSQTRVTLTELQRQLVDDLHQVLGRDIEELHIELEVAGKMIKK
ncbi:5-bromo-4-chloroindolyl phosphate hydrolysis family protein [Bacillus sp. NPDC077027]|uniref:5-bromo-4-chloroindolyl phosphate hydrolysis family protein n=1 Tax=Bacillus sp. NPDC077027 TaxID=3390548 RepID=UPI003D025546